jgi:hypothetical protein
MSKEIQALAAPGSVVYAQIIRETDGKIWNTSGTPAFEDYVTANIANYAIAMAQAGTASGIYTGTFPSTIPAGRYSVVARVRAGGSPAEADAVAGAGEILWDGTAVQSAIASPTNITAAKLAPDGLDAVSTTMPAGVAANFREMIVATWAYDYQKSVYDPVAQTLTTYAANGSTVLTTAPATIVSGLETKGKAV